MQKPLDEDNPNDPRSAFEYQIQNPDVFADNMLKYFEHVGQAYARFVERPDSSVSPFSAASELTEATRAMTEIGQQWLSNPMKLAEAQMDLASGYGKIWNNVLRRMAGEDLPPVAAPSIKDNRFKDAEWTDNLYFDFWKQMYVLTSEWAEKSLQKTEGLDPEAKTKAEFYMRLLSSAFAPTNFPATNPEVWRETLNNNGENLVRGMELFLSDMEKSQDLLKISQTDVEAFEIGSNLAITPGKVVYQNELFQLIQYTPTTEQVRETPILVVPPWINKYYILDLTPPKSLLAYAVAQGLTVFVISWINPDETLSDKTFEDYMTEGVLAAADAVRRETGVAKCNLMGYCVGGTLASTTLAYTSARAEELFNSATLLATQTDFSNAGDLLMFVTDDQLENIRRLVDQEGFLDGSRMANVFNMLRPGDLIWPYIVNNYLLGRKPFPFDLLYWNQDSTRMPAANLNFYLREYYNQNKLSKGELVIGGLELSLDKIKTPVFHLATREDHIAPARSVFKGAKKFGGPVDFVLAGSGHIAGVINPPSKIKYQHWTGDLAAGETLDDWSSQAEAHPGSWWPLWATWIAKRSGDWVAPREPGARLGTIEDAPGSYVKVRY